MKNNYLSTIPQFADKLRVKGVQKPQYNNYNYLPQENSNPSNEEYWYRWGNEAQQNMLDGLQNIKSSKRDLLKEAHYPRRNKTTAQVPFASSQSMEPFQRMTHSINKQNFKFPSNVENKFSGSGNITQSLALPDKVFNENIRKLIRNRVRNLNEIAGMPVLPPQPVSPDVISDEDRRQLDLTLTSLSSKASNGVADAASFDDVNQIYNYFINNIWKYSDSSELLSYIRSLEQVQQSLNDLVITINDTVLSGRPQGQYLQYAASIYNTINELIDYIKKAMNNIGRTSQERKALASLVKGQNINGIRLTARQQQQPQAQPQPSQVDQFLSAQLPSQLEYIPELKPIEDYTQIQQEPDAEFNSDVLNQVMPVNFDVARFVKQIKRTYNTFKKINMPEVIKLAKLFGVNDRNPDGTPKGKEQIYNELSSIRARTGLGKPRHKSRKGGFYYDPFASFDRWVNCQMGLKGFC